MSKVTITHPDSGQSAVVQETQVEAWATRGWVPETGPATALPVEDAAADSEDDLEEKESESDSTNSRQRGSN